jgi:hypothetical protein
VLEHARQFLERVLPPLPSDRPAYINIHWSGLSSEGRRFWDGRACESIDEAVKNIAWANKMGDKDIYVCMSTQAKAETKTSVKGNAYKKALRLADDVVAIRSLFIDVDVKEGAYPDTKTALAALKGFVDAVGLPMPSACVGSGSGGFHAHWALDQSLPAAEWQVLANALSAAIRAHGLIADTQCTVDSARILRIPETFNRKSDVPREVTLMSLGEEVSLDHMRALLGKWVTAGPFEQGLPRKDGTSPMAMNDELGANLETKSSLFKVTDIAKVCGFTARQLGTGGKDTPQPLWFMAASLACFMEDGREVFHQMSDQHPGYNRVATDELYDRVASRQKTRDLGWPHCDKIASYGCKDCETCPLLTHLKTPFSFLNQADNDEPEI